MTEFHYYCSDEDAESEDEGPPRPKRGRNKQWVFQFQFSNMKEAEEFVSAENTWSRKFTRTTEEGQKRFYRCNKVKKKGPQCAAELYLLFDCKSNDVLVYNIDAEHTHDEIGARGCGIDEITKMEINRLSSLRLKPKAILSALENMEGIKLPTKMQLNNYLNDRRRSNLGQSTIKSTIHLGELENWINEHTAIPEDENETFVMKHLIFKNDQPNFRFVLTTIKLLKFAHSCDVIHADAIHKLIWQGFPVLIVGATNRNREFFPICLAVSTNEQEDDFQMIFSALKEKIRSIFDQDFQPKVLVCDSSQAIKNAFLRVFGSDTTVRVCWTHAKRNILKKVEQTIEKTTRKDVLQDFDALHNAPSGEVFNAASRAFIAKHATHTAFIDYFEQQWLIENPNWFLGAATPSPVTNNALESFNKTIKDHNTLRERFSLSHFLAVVSEMVTQWSNQISDTLPVTLKFDLQEWTEGYLWAKKNVEIKILSSDATNSVYLAPSESTIRIKDTNTAYESWQTFDEYRERNFAFWRIELPRAEWTNGTCTCPQFFKKYMCKHILGLAIRLNLASPPLEAKIIPSPQSRKRGRPSKSKPALIL